MASLTLASLKHISSLSFVLSPLSASEGARSVRLLLARIPSKLPPAPQAAALGLAKLPEVKVDVAPVGKEQDVGVKVTYSNKQTVEFKLGADSKMGIAELMRKVEAPARALRLKEQGV